MNKQSAQKTKNVNKTQATSNNVIDFLNQVEPSHKKSDCFHLLNLFQEITQQPPLLWGTSIIGFGQYHYKYDSGREGDFFMVGFAPRKKNIVLYIMPGFDTVQNLLNALGKFKTGKSCLYINKLSDIDEITLKQLICTSFKQMKKKHFYA